MSGTLAAALAEPTELRAYLEDHYGRPEKAALSSWERVEMTLAQQEPDRVPFDFWAVPEVWDRLRAALGIRDGALPQDDASSRDEEVLRLLGVDCRLVVARYVGGKARQLPDGTRIDAWGTHRRRVSNEFSAYDEYARYPLAEAETVADVQDWDWASPDDWDVSGVREQCERLSGLAGRWMLDPTSVQRGSRTPSRC